MSPDKNVTFKYCFPAKFLGISKSLRIFENVICDKKVTAQVMGVVNQIEK